MPLNICSSLISEFRKRLITDLQTLKCTSPMEVSIWSANTFCLIQKEVERKTQQCSSGHVIKNNSRLCLLKTHFYLYTWLQWTKIIHLFLHSSIKMFFALQNKTRDSIEWFIIEMCVPVHNGTLTPKFTWFLYVFSIQSYLFCYLFLFFLSKINC